ncbi:MAG: S41 family peptidase [Marinilabiliaceae bacterium]
MTEKRKNTYRQIYLPVVLALVLVGGMFLGRMTDTSGSTEGRRTLDFSSSSETDSRLESIIDLIDRNYVDSIDRKEFVDEVIPKILKELDPHTVYIPPEDLQVANEQLQGNFGGIGVEFSMQDDTVMVISVVPGGPSEEEGILPGDRIITVNDSLIAGENVPTNDVVNMLRGDKGTEVTVGIKRRNRDSLIDFDITRGEIPMHSVDVSYKLNDTTGYMKINRFAQNTYDEMVDGLAELKSNGCKHLVMDLRGNSGGYLEVAIQVVNEFLDDGDMIVYTEGASSPRQTVNADGSGSCKNTGITVLIDEFSASASEIFAGAMQDNDRGLVLGRRSFGKGLVQQQFPLPDDGALRLTVARYYTPSGRSIQKPYDNGVDDYYKDIIQRYEHGEFFNKDSVDIADSLVYETANGRHVYGGGGIMPDVFVPRDTSDHSEYYYRLRETGSIYKFALQYSDNHRDQLKKFEDVEALEKHLEDQNVANQLVDFASNEGVKFKPEEYEKSRELIELETKAYIARNILDNEGFYPIIAEQDEVLQKTMEVFKSGADSILSDQAKK